MQKPLLKKQKLLWLSILAVLSADYDKLYAVVESKKHLFKAKEGNMTSERESSRRLVVYLYLLTGAHSHCGQVKNGKMAGEWADFTAFSFHAVKNFTTAEGGASYMA